MRTIHVAVAAVLGGVFVAGCSSDDSGKGNPAGAQAGKSLSREEALNMTPDRGAAGGAKPPNAANAGSSQATAPDEGGK
ncbi:MAG: hypothetical protein WCK51_10895 [Armatimonadota bacterium]